MSGDPVRFDGPTSMNEQNPYKSPEAESYANAAATKHEAAPPELAIASNDPSPAVSTGNTVLPRHMAAILDNLIAMILGVMAAKAINEDLLAVQSLLFVATYLGYYFLFEGFISRTPGKLLTGVMVIQFDGGRCTWRQSLIRTCFRVLEVNPALLGAIPAALSIVLSRHHQRFGDKMARTVVVLSRRVRKQR